MLFSIPIATAAVGAYALARRGLRSWRTLIMMLAMLGMQGLAFATLDIQLATTVAGSTLVVEAALVFMVGDVLSPTPAADREFATHLAGVLAAINQLKARQVSDAAEYRSQFAAIINRLELLSAPDAEWAALRSDMVDHLRLRLAAMEAHAMITTEFVERADSAWAALEQRYRDLLEAHSRFWLPWP